MMMTPRTLCIPSLFVCVCVCACACVRTCVRACAALVTPIVIAVQSQVVTEPGNYFAHHCRCPTCQKIDHDLTIDLDFAADAIQWPADFLRREPPITAHDALKISSARKGRRKARERREKGQCPAPVYEVLCHLSRPCSQSPGQVLIKRFRRHYLLAHVFMRRPFCDGRCQQNAY